MVNNFETIYVSIKNIWKNYYLQSNCFCAKKNLHKEYMVQLNRHFPRKGGKYRMERLNLKFSPGFDHTLVPLIDPCHLRLVGVMSVPALGPLLIAPLFLLKHDQATKLTLSITHGWAGKLTINLVLITSTQQ